MKILLIDDEPDYMEKLVTSLEQIGYQCRQMEDSVQAAELLKREKFDVVITDIAMPGCNGFELIETVRLNQSANLVIAISGQLDKNIEGEAIRTGADAFLTKPLHLQTLIEVINSDSSSSDKIERTTLN